MTASMPALSVVEVTASLPVTRLLIPVLLPLSPSPLLLVTGMLAPTHLAFGLLAASLAGLLTGTPPTPAAFACAALGALLPDIDTTSSAIGRLLYPLAAFIEQRFGHRSITHSLAGLTIAALLAYGLLLIADSFHLPFAISHPPSAIRHQPSAISYFAFITGYASHLIADSTTKAGIPLFWPSLTFQAVFPGNEDYRLRVGSSAEYVLLAILLPLTTISLPLSQISLTQALHYLIRDVNSAAADYQTWAGQYLVWVEIEGRHNLSQKPVHGLFEAIDTAGQNAIIIRDRQGDIYAAGQSRNDEVYVHRIRAIRGTPIRTEIQEVRLTNQPLGDLFSHTSATLSTSLAIQPSTHPAIQLSNHPAIETWLQGWFVTPQRPILIDDVGEFNRSKRAQSVAGQSLYEIRYFTPQDLAPLRDIYVTRAHFIIRTVYSERGRQGEGVTR